MMIISLYGIVNYFKSPDLILGVNRYTDTYFGRLCSSYICPNHFAHLLQMIIPYCVCYLFLKKGHFFLNHYQHTVLLFF